MNCHESLHLLGTKLNRLLVKDDNVGNLLAALGILPLPIVQANSCIKLSTDEYYVLIGRYIKVCLEGEECLAREAWDQLHNASTSSIRMTTWQIAFNQIRHEKGGFTFLNELFQLAERY